MGIKVITITSILDVGLAMVAISIDFRDLIIILLSFLLILPGLLFVKGALVLLRLGHTCLLKEKLESVGTNRIISGMKQRLPGYRDPSAVARRPGSPANHKSQVRQKAKERKRETNSYPYRMRSVTSPLEVDHTIDAGERCAATLVAMGIELLLGKDITARLGTNPSY